ncbi:hypothetical protein AYK26_05145 [Euryarchaeota archaeon SM23-78]|nr:MAG: hypothetical protein AYK26_05145 [Euryarchaeota archaeon SM23-78]
MIIIVALTAIVAMITVMGTKNGSSGNFRVYGSGTGTITETIPPPVGVGSTNEVLLYKISFGGRLGLNSRTGWDGNWHIRFQDVSQNELDRTRFQLTEIDNIEFDYNCGKIIYVSGTGKLNKTTGWLIFLELAEQEVGGEDVESIRIQISYPGKDWMYDTATDFDNNLGCPGHTILDSGKIFVKD